MTILKKHITGILIWFVGLAAISLLVLGFVLDFEDTPSTTTICKEIGHGKYHNLDKEYEFEVLFGVRSDTADVLGLLEPCSVPEITASALTTCARKMIGKVELPYPHFSAKTVAGKPLHVWKLEGKIDSIKIPTKKSTLFSLTLLKLRTCSPQEVYVYAREKIETIPQVTDERKALSNDFRREDVRKAWDTFLKDSTEEEKYYVATFSCICSSGTYMRTLAELIANELGTCGLAYSIKRTQIGSYFPLPFGLGFWKKLF